MWSLIPKDLVVQTGEISGSNYIRVKLLENEGIQVYKLQQCRHSSQIHQHKEESPRLKVIPQVFRK